MRKNYTQKEREQIRVGLEQKLAFEKAVEETKTRAFWHICEGCGKRELLTSKEAFETGWDYPGADSLYKDGKHFGFRMLAPRTCGECSIMTSIFWKMMSGEDFTNADQEVLERIKKEPMCLFGE